MNHANPLAENAPQTAHLWTVTSDRGVEGAFKSEGEANSFKDLMECEGFEGVKVAPPNTETQPKE